jgi:hypothetical protein
MNTFFCYQRIQIAIKVLPWSEIVSGHYISLGGINMKRTRLGVRLYVGPTFLG